MIAKISTGNYAAGMVKYNHNKTISFKSGQVEAELITTKNIPKRDFKTIVETIEAYNNKNTRVHKPNIHISLNFHKEDVLDNEKILEIGNDYMTQMGFKDHPYAVYRHFDREHPHIHIVSSQINEKGKKINDSHIYFRSQALTRKLEEKYNITRAVEKNGILNEIDIHKAINEHLEQGKHSLTGILKRVLLETLNLKPTTEKEFKKMLKNYQVKRILSYDENKNIKGNYFDLVPIEYLNEKKGHKRSIGIEGRALDGNFGYEAIQVQLEMNARQKNALQNQIMGKVYSVINPILAPEKNDLNNSNLTINLSDLKLELKKKGIELIVKRTQTGENLNSIYGLIFKDIKINQTYSASDLKLKTSDFIKHVIDDEKFKSNEVKKQNSQEYNYVQPFSQNEDNSTKNNSVSSTLGLFSSLLSTAYVSNDNPELPKKQKKRRYRYK
jgi:hypothetical protein